MCLLHQLLSGRVPWDSLGWTELLSAVLIRCFELRYFKLRRFDLLCADRTHAWRAQPYKKSREFLLRNVTLHPERGVTAF